MPDYTIEDQIREVKREIALRKRVYPMQIEAGKMADWQAEAPLGKMESVLKTLERAKANETQQPTLWGEENQ